MTATLDSLVHNQFPARVLHPDGTYTDRCRAAMTVDLLVVYIDATEGGRKRPRTALKVGIVSSRPDGKDWVATDTEGGQWRISRGNWCGCGSGLKAMPSPLPVDL